MYSLEQISEFVTDNFDKEPEFIIYNIKPTKKFVENFAIKIKELLDNGECECIEDAWCLILMFTDYSYWEYISLEQQIEIAKEKEKKKEELRESLRNICDSDIKGLINIEEIF